LIARYDSAFIELWIFQYLIHRLTCSSWELALSFVNAFWLEMGPKRRVRPLVQEERKNIPQLKYGKEKEKNVFVRGDS
jgi:hypothetical protein